jgi:hypothetical protein
LGLAGKRGRESRERREATGKERRTGRGLVASSSVFGKPTRSGKQEVASVLARGKPRRCSLFSTKKTKPNCKKPPGFGRFSREKQNSTSFWYKSILGICLKLLKNFRDFF